MKAKTRVDKYRISETSRPFEKLLNTVHTFVITFLPNVNLHWVPDPRAEEKAEQGGVGAQNVSRPVDQPARANRQGA